MCIYIYIDVCVSTTKKKSLFLSVKKRVYQCAWEGREKEKGGVCFERTSVEPFVEEAEDGEGVA